MSKVKVDYGNIPDEMKELRQFVCFDVESNGEKERKIPYTPGTEKKARSNDAATWRTFDEAMCDVVNGVRQYVGFCLSEEDPYVFFDLDEPTTDEQKENLKEIYQLFNSFSEKSIGGKGVHIIAKGELKGRGLHNEYFGLFDSCRFILLTGHILQGRDKIRRANTDKLSKLQSDVRTSDNRGYNFPLEEKEWDMPDWALYNRTMRVYKKKFIDLMGGDWKRFGEYPSQSEADHALLSMLCEFTESNALVRYMFAESGLYREWKGGGRPHTYIDYTIQYQREKTQRAVERREEVREMAQKNLKAEVSRKKAAEKSMKSSKKKKKSTVIASAPAIHTTDKDYSDLSDSDFTADMEDSSEIHLTDLIDKVPSKLHRMLATWLYQNSFIPNQKISIVTASMIITSFTQRAYLTPSSTGLNLNWWLVAESGKGKDIMVKGMDMVVNELILDIPHLAKTQVGKMASGEAIETVIGEQPRFTSKVTEAGVFWRKLMSPNKLPHIDALYGAMLELFMTTDAGAYYQSRRKAKKDDDIVNSIFRPAGSFYGESTFTDFFGDLDMSSVGTGLLQRQVIVGIEKVKYVEENFKRSAMPRELKDLMIETIGICDTLDLTNDTVSVKISRRAKSKIKDHTARLRKYSYSKEKSELRAEYLNRTIIKIWKFASQMAVGNDPHNPGITEAQIDYATALISGCDEYMLKKFTSGEVGNGQLKQEADIMKIVKTLVGASVEKRKKSYRFNGLVAEDVTLLTYSKLRGDAKLRSSFQADRLGAITAIDRCIDSLCRAGILSRLTRDEAHDEYGTSANLLRYNGS